MESLRFFFNPRSIAVVGVSRDPSKLGSVIYRRLMENRASGILEAEIYPVNPRLRELEGVKVYPRVSEIEGDVELVVIAVPAEFVPEVLRDSGRKGARAAIIISGGFAESGRDDLNLELERAVKESGVRALGPNTLGVLDPYSGVDTFFLPRFKPISRGGEAENLPEPVKGNVAVISQSGALSEILMDCLKASGVGVRAIACVGNQVDVKVEEFLRYFAEDELTKVIAIYLEGVRDGRRFMEAAADAARRKPVVILKAGKTEVAGKAAYTHTASMVGNIHVYRGAFKQAGVIEVMDMEEMVDVVKAFSMRGPARGNRLLILTNAGGLAVLSSDMAPLYGLTVPKLTEDLKERLEELRRKGVVAPIVVFQNPLDLTAQATSETFEQVYRILASSNLFDLHLIMPSHQPPTIDDTVIERLARVASESDAAVAVSELGESEWSRLIREGFDGKGIPAYPELSRAIRALARLTHYRKPRRARFDHPSSSNRFEWLNGLDGPLKPEDAVKLLGEYGVNVPRSRLARSEEEAVKAAEELGFPVVLKLVSREVAHKTDVGGVLVGLKKRDEVAEGYRVLKRKVEELGVTWEGVLIQEMIRGVEVLLGSSWDEVFGPTVSVGVGGIFTEAMRDFSVRVAPIEPWEAEEMLGELRLKKLLEGFRGMPRVDVRALAEIISRFSRITFENPSIKQLEINPLMVAGERAVAVDVRGWVRRG